jgi:hypothetical protein
MSLSYDYVIHSLRATFGKLGTFQKFMGSTRFPTINIEW